MMENVVYTFFHFNETNKIIFPFDKLASDNRIWAKFFREFRSVTTFLDSNRSIGSTGDCFLLIN